MAQLHIFVILERLQQDQTFFDSLLLYLLGRTLYVFILLVLMLALREVVQLHEKSQVVNLENFDATYLWDHVDLFVRDHVHHTGVELLLFLVTDHHQLIQSLRLVLRRIRVREELAHFFKIS
jgi:hypothetical protein